MADQNVVPQTEPAAESPDAPIPPEEQPSRTALQRFLERIPYTQAFSRRILEDQNSAYELRRYQYNELVSLDGKLKAKLSWELDSNARNLSQAEAWANMGQFYVRCFTLALLVVSWVTVPLFISRHVPQLGGWEVRGFWWWALEVLLAIVIAALGALIFMMPFLSVNDGGAYKFFNLDALILPWSVALLIIASSYLYAMRIGVLSTWPSIFRHRLFSYLVMEAGFLGTLFFATALPNRLFRWMLDNRMQRVHTRAVIIDKLLDIVSDMERTDYDFYSTDPAYRSSMTKRLENIASCFENHFP